MVVVGRWGGVIWGVEPDYYPTVGPHQRLIYFCWKYFNEFLLVVKAKIRFIGVG